MDIKNTIGNIIDKLKAIFVNYPVNDPGVPLVINQEIPDLPNPCPPFVVQGFNGQSDAPHSLQWQAAGVYSIIANSLKFVQANSANPIVRWARTNQLVAVPRAGVQFNAYYDGSSLRFFYNNHPKDGHTVFTCESSDVVSHELGHAILDSFRPDLWTVQAIEIHAFHEAFGDINAILSALAHPEVIDFVINETGGNMHNSNMVSRLAEEMGDAIYAQMNRPADALRNAVNSFKYSTPELLPNNSSVDQLSREPHSFSRVFTGGFYDFLTLQFDKNSKTMPQRDALMLARDQAAFTIYNAVRQAANTPRFYDSVVRAMMLVDNNRGSICREAIEVAFSERGIIQPSLMLPNMTNMPQNKSTTVFRHKEGSAVRVGGIKEIKLENEMNVKEDNPLYSVAITVSDEHYIEYDDKGKMKLDRPVIKNEILNSAKDCLDYLNQQDLVSYDEKAEPDKQFSVVDGKLIRNFVCCHR